MSDTAIPILDLSRVSPAGAEFGDALASCGFAILENHGLPRTHWDEAYAAAASAFALDPAVKERYCGPCDGSQRGYLPYRTHLPDGRDAMDRKECWHVRLDGHRHPNLFPSEVPELGPRMQDLLVAVDRIAARVLDGLDAYLGNPDRHFRQMVEGSDSLFRVNHYPDLALEPGRLRFRPHRDFDLVTLLLGATKPGLEVQGRDGTWVAITSPTGIVINAGDMLAVESAGTIPSTAHRVVAPPVGDGGRMSMVYFVAPRNEIVLRNGQTAAAFLDDRLREAGYLA